MYTQCTMINWKNKKKSFWKNAVINILLVLRKYHIEGKAWNAMKSPFRARHIIDSMFIKGLVTWRHDDAILENRYYVDITIDIITCKDQRENVEIINKFVFFQIGDRDSITTRKWFIQWPDQIIRGKFTGWEET